MSEQVIYTNPERPEYVHAEVSTYNPKLEWFVQGPLTECMRAAYPSIRRLLYVEDLEDKRPHAMRKYGQAVIIEFCNGYSKVANVEGDSEWGCIEDVMRCILR